MQALTGRRWQNRRVSAANNNPTGNTSNMARIHKLDTHGEFTVATGGEIDFLTGFTDDQTFDHLKQMGVNEEVIERAIQAAQKILDDFGAKVHVAQFSIEAVPEVIAGKCQCGSRCTSWGCQPYRSCTTAPNGTQTCVNGHRTVCTGMSCNPC